MDMEEKALKNIYKSVYFNKIQWETQRINLKQWFIHSMFGIVWWLYAVISSSDERWTSFIVVFIVRVCLCFILRL